MPDIDPLGLREKGKITRHHTSHCRSWNENGISSGWTGRKQVYCHLREGVAGIFWWLNVFRWTSRAEWLRWVTASVPSPSRRCYNRRGPHLCAHHPAAEEMTSEQVDCFNYAVAVNNPWWLQELLLVSRDCSGTNLRTLKLSQNRPSLEHSRFLVVLQHRARGLQKPEAIGCFRN